MTVPRATAAKPIGFAERAVVNAVTIGVIVFNIVNKDGVVCSTFESYIFYAKHINICGLKNSKVVLHNLHLAAGNYHLDAFLFDDKGTLLDFIARSITFKSDTPASNGEGILATENEWELK